MKIDRLTELAAWLQEISDFAELADDGLSFDVVTEGQTCAFSVTEERLECRIATREEGLGSSMKWIGSGDLHEGSFSRETWESIKKAIMDTKATESDQ